MNRIKLAVIFLNSSDYSKHILQRHVAGVELFQRLILTLNRSGLDENIIISHGFTFEEKREIETKVIKDNRFNGKLTWYDREDFLKDNGLEKIRSAAGAHGILFTNGNIVTTSRYVKNFVHSILNSKAPERKVITGMPYDEHNNGGLFFVPVNRLNLIDQYMQTPIMDTSIETIQPPAGGTHPLSSISRLVFLATTGAPLPLDYIRIAHHLLLRHHHIALDSGLARVYVSQQTGSPEFLATICGGPRLALRKNRHSEKRARRHVYPWS